MISSDDGSGLSIHDGIVPSEVRETDFVHARIRGRGKDVSFESIQVWRMSPLGLELLQKDKAMIQFVKGDSIDLQLVVEGRRADFSGLIVDVVSQSGSASLLGVRFLVSEKRIHSRLSPDDRNAQRWLCSEEHIPRAISPAPGRFNEFIGYRINNISRKGLQLTTNLTNGYLVPGMRLTLSIHLPLVAEMVVKVEIVRLRIGTAGAEEILEVGVVMIDPTAHSLGLLGQYLAQFSRDSSLDELVAAGMIPNNLNLGISFYPLKNEDDYRDVLHLRSVDSEIDGKSELSFADERDRKSRVVVGKLGGKTIATARVRYPSAEDSLEVEQGFPGDIIEKRSDELIEVGAVCVDSPPEIRDLILLALLRYISTSCISSERHTVLITLSNSNDRRLIRKAGWKEIYTEKSHYLIADAYKAIQGRDVSPIFWNFVWRSAADYLIEVGEIRPSGPERVMLRAFKLFGFLSKIYFQLKKMPSTIDGNLSR